MLSLKCQCSSTSVRVTQLKAKEMHLKMDLAFVLRQLGQPVTFASRASTLEERKYSQIRKELLAQVFSMEHNHHHVYVQKVILWTDHKLLVSILWKPPALVFKRLHRLLMWLQQYDCEIRYKPGKEMLLADTLSRAYSEDYERSASKSEVECINATHFLPVPDHQLNELQRETACDPTLQFVKKAILDSFPDTKDEQPGAIQQYRFSSTNSRGRLFLFSHKKGAIIRGKVITPMYFKYCSLEVVP